MAVVVTVVAVKAPARAAATTMAVARRAAGSKNLIFVIYRPCQLARSCARGRALSHREAAVQVEPLARRPDQEEFGRGLGLAPLP